MHRKSLKKKLTLSDFSRCHPSRRTVSNRCLPRRVYSSLSKRLHSKKVYETLGCKIGEDHCLLDKAPLPEDEKKELRKTYLRPKMPAAWSKDPDMWLDNFNIMDVMRQYEQAFPWFKFLGVFPIDFSAPNPYRKNGSQQCLYRETCDLDLKQEYSKGVRGIGMVFNLDPHFKSGSHWVGLYINLQNIKKPLVGYFDSYGLKTPPLIARLMKSFRLQISTCDLAYNARRFQYNNSECGMFSMYFIICMIHGIRFEDFCKDAVHDETMLSLRTILFAH